MGKLLKLSVSAAIVAATCGALASAGVSAQTLQQTAAACSSPAYTAPYGYAYGGPQATCQVSLPDQQLTQPETLIVEAGSSGALDPSSCQGIDGYGYTTAAVNGEIPFSYSGQFANSGFCTFEVTSGTVPPSAPIGSFALASSYGAGQALDSLVCGDPSCGAAPAVSYYNAVSPQVIYSPPVYSPPTPPAIYTAPAPVYSPPPADNDSDNGAWNGASWSGSDSQGHNWNGGDRWQGSQGGDQHGHQANGSGDANQHHDNQNAGGQSGATNHHHDNGSGH